MTQETRELAEKIYVALIGNSARYKAMQKLIEEDEGWTHKELTEKNINKAVMMAEQFYEHVNS